MKNKLSCNKGISLVEILVSLAIVAIMIIPIGNMVNTLIKTNKRSEVRQQAILLGQQILEEIESLEEIKSNRIELSGGEIDGSEGNDKFQSVYTTNDYKKEKDNYSVKIVLEENEDIKYNHSNNTPGDTISTIEDKFGLETYGLSSEIKIYKDNIVNTIPIDSNDVKLNIEFINEGGITKLKIKNNESQINTYDLKDNKVIFNFTNKYKLKEGITISVVNSLSEPVDMYIQKSYECEEKVYLERTFGNLNVYNIREEDDIKDAGMSNLYNITVDISKNNKQLFTGSGNKNIKIND